MTCTVPASRRNSITFLFQSLSVNICTHLLRIHATPTDLSVAQIPLGQNIKANRNSTVTDGTYIGFLVLTFLGALLAWTLVPASSVIRKDGSRVILIKNPTWKTELVGLYQTFKTDSYIILLFPMFFISNFFYTYQFNDVNLARFNTRTRALNNTLYWTSQIIGAFVFGYALDMKRFPRRTRALGAWAALLVLTMAIWGGGYAFQRQYTRADIDAIGYVKMDWTDSGYVGPMFLMMFYGFYDAVWQTYVYWYVILFLPACALLD